MFGNLGEMAGLMKKAKDMQKNMKVAQEEIANMEARAESGGGLVEAIVGGDMSLKKICIKSECLADKETLEDLVLAAVNNALNDMKAQSQEKLSKVTGGLDLAKILG